MMKEPTTEMAAWPEDSRRYVQALKEALEACRSERAHYAASVLENEDAWGAEQSLRDQVEGLAIRNAELDIECERLRAERSCVGKDG
jgi:hypothetical protein